MPDWSSNAEILKDSGIFVKLQHALLGLYAWEWFISLPFDWEVITGRKRFRWPLIFYFANRYLLLGALIGIAIGFDTFEEINCQSLYTFNQLAGDAAVGFASINLSLRTIAIWSQNTYIKVFLVVIILGHWSLILQGVLLDAQWSNELGTCVIKDTNTTILAATFTYSMVFDLIVFCLNAYKLGVRRRGKSKLTKMIFKDGLLFFFIAFLANLIATIFMFLKLNPVMSVVFNVPAAIASTIVATRAVRRLTNFTSHGPEMYQPSASSSGAVRSYSGARGLTHTGRGGYKGQQGVHVQMETFVRAEEGFGSPTSESPIALKRQAEQGSVEYDLETKAPGAF
ncbi:hypothetical protein MIND_00127700 [Mycena indigotica]|uniref:Transmembrane protein n=1 Tax=Mycena indigotica TaxID=2126181 RepID=A0A8H6WGP6_9AGAR|nr:uncharacterized protein MIND_00127700 [Mycena indigotica]KAF7316096.1 hypothetical protein MIND_00127700 [Mycena indigotica]